MKTTMKTRVLTSVALIAVLLPFVIFSHTWVFPCFMALLSAVAAYEILHCLGCHTKWYTAVPAYAVSIVFVLLTRLTDRFLDVTVMISMVYLFFLMSAAVFSHGKFTMVQACQLFAMTLYTTTGFLSIVRLRDLEHGQFIFLLAFLVPWISDVFAYFTGSLIGKHKLIPDVSPKKTVEGALGGVVFGTLSLLLYGFAVGAFFEAHPRYVGLLLMGVVLTVVSQCGDLIASLLKRQYGIKDYGWIFPGHGGVLDRFDSIVATATFLYLLSSFPKIFGIFF